MKKEEFAVIATGGKQYKVSEGGLVSVEKIKTTGVEYKKGDKISFDKVLDEGKTTLTGILDEFKKNERNIGASLITSIISTSQQQRSLGSCLKCNGSLVLRTSKYDTQFIGCSNYPNCTFTISLPKGKLKKSGICSKCNYAKITVLGKKPWSFCVNPECPSKKKYQNNNVQEQSNNIKDTLSE